MPLYLIEKAVAEQSGWIEKKKREAEEKNSDNPPKRYIDGEIFYLLGKEIPLEIVPGERGLRYHRQTFLLSENVRPLSRKLFESWYKAFAESYIPGRVDFFSKRMGVRPKNVKVNSAESRWGSCGSNGNINFAARLAAASPEAIDYVVVHELAHLVELNHSRKFWTIVEKYFPDYKKQIDYLKENSRKFEL